ncbi:MAG: glycerophosphoryl diester phosphodiesterase [Coxiella sp. (in: Bacteria)]|nr:MAG: glycerophosphoryl diester phosphodiesterase [Coxiella sp. (in: g-proteobacteria)]
MANFPSIAKYIGHRGAPVHAPENTIASLRKAKELGATWIEFDVRLTQNGQPIIMHDNTLNRTTNGRGKVAKTPFSDMANLDAGEGQQVPLLDRWLRVAAELNLGVNIEIKESALRATEVALQVYQALQKSWTPDLPSPLVSSVVAKNLLAYRTLDPAMALALIVTSWPWGCLSKLKAVDASALVIRANSINAKRVKKLHDAGYKVLVYTVNKASEAQKLFDMGVDSVFTDDLTICG